MFDFLFFVGELWLFENTCLFCLNALRKYCVVHFCWVGYDFFKIFRSSWRSSVFVTVVSFRSLLGASLFALVIGIARMFAVRFAALA